MFLAVACAFMAVVFVVAVGTCLIRVGEGE